MGIHPINSPSFLMMRSALTFNMIFRHADFVVTGCRTEDLGGSIHDAEILCSCFIPMLHERSEMFKTLNYTCMVVLMTAALSDADDPANQNHNKSDAHSMLQSGVALMVPMQDSDVTGLIHLKQMDGFVHLSGRIEGLQPGQHGFHIHEFGDLTKRDGTSAGGHFNPEGHPHAGPDDEKRHAGDLGNVDADDSGVAEVDIRAEGLQLTSVLGRSLVVHAKADDLKSQPSGDAGARKAVGVIGIAKNLGHESQ